MDGTLLSNPLLDAALKYAKIGFHVIPVEPRGKIPMVEWKQFQQQKPTEEQIRSWWSAEPEANVAIVLGRGTCAVDIDGEIGHESLRLHGFDLPRTAPRVRTGRPGGEHVYLSGTVPDKVRLVDGVDIRGVGIAVAPPSIHASGSTYHWIVEPTGLSELPPIPGTLLAKLSQHGLYAPENKPEWVAELIRNGSPEGQRNSDGARLAGYLYRALPHDVAKATLYAWAEHCTPPLPSKEVETIHQSISRRAKADVGLRSLSPDELREDTQRASEARTVGSILLGMIPAVQRATFFIKTPYSKLNDLLHGGIAGNEYTIVGGRPGVGKTAWCLEVATAAAKAGHRVLIVTLEMSAEQLASRLASHESGIPAGELRRGGVAGERLRQLQGAIAVLRHLPVVIEAGLTRADQVYSHVEQARSEGDGYGLVIVDYLQLLAPNVVLKDHRRLEIDASSENLKKIARQLNVPVIAISNLLNGMGEPELEHLKESGNLQYQADIVLLLHRDRFDQRMKVKVAKARNAETGVFWLWYDGQQFSFSETIPHPEPEKPKPDFDEPF